MLGPEASDRAMKFLRKYFEELDDCRKYTVISTKRASQEDGTEVIT